MPQYVKAVTAGGGDVLYALGQGLWTSRDAGRSWRRIGAPPSWTTGIAASRSKERVVYAATGSGVMVSTDEGTTWRRAFAGHCRQPISALATGADGAVYAFSLCQGLLRGDEPSGSWTVVADDFDGCIIQHLAVDPSNDEVVFAVERCRTTVVSVDGGQRWSMYGSTSKWRWDCLSGP